MLPNRASNQEREQRLVGLNPFGNMGFPVLDIVDLFYLTFPLTPDCIFGAWAGAYTTICRYWCMIFADSSDFDCGVFDCGVGCFYSLISVTAMRA